MRSLAGEDPGEETVAVSIEAYSEDVRGWSGTRGSGVGDDVLTPKKEGGVSRDRACGGGLEGLRGGGEFLAKVERDST